jgi:hypothetical protein
VRIYRGRRVFVRRRSHRLKEWAKFIVMEERSHTDELGVNPISPERRLSGKPIQQSRISALSS